jgi:putative ABC transport system ATP-binding protein
MDDAVIQMSGVTKTYPMGEVEVHALRGIDLGVQRGRMVVILGPSGCGKTTTLNLIGGLDRPSSGSLVVGGEDIARMNDARLTRYRREKVGFVFQFFNLIPTLSAAENIELALTLNRDRTRRPRENGGMRKRAQELLGLVGLEGRTDHFPSQLSGGEQQRVAIARSLANDPSVLLCDEPTGNLDLETGVQVLGAIRDLNRRQGATVILVTHNSAIAPLADQIVRLRNGVIEKIEDVREPIELSQVTW